ncbi:MAG TPA: hypothetical protein VGX02_09765 [Candidatus Eremiobacteraceae bacterium]|jgi:hypothetical protein|nr:hypothetical protein [Candidatus Eremiobacteraceae bacterium]
MEVVIVGGPHSGVGKTLAAEVALRALDGLGYGAIKLTVADGERDPEHDHGSSALSVAHAAGICGRGASCGVCETVSGKLPSRLIVSEGAIHKRGTDTWRLANAGAVAVAWIIALREAAPAAVEAAMRHLESKGASGVVIEGTTALDWLVPRASVIVATDPGRKWKDVALRHVGDCDIVLRNTPPVPSGDLATPVAFAAASPRVCDLGRFDEPGTQWYAARLRELCAPFSVRANS